MDCPILRLCPVIWSQITLYLSVTPTLNLIFAGSPQLSSALARGVHQLRFTGALPHVDHEAIIQCCKHFPSVETIIVNPSSLHTYGINLTRPLQFPSLLLYLSVRHNFATRLLLVEQDLSKSAPNLISLKIYDRGATEIDPRRIKLPQNLHTLKLVGALIDFTKSIREIKRLPRSLTYLGLMCTQLPKFEEYEWPLSLSTLLLHCNEKPICIEELPRTVTKLRLRGDPLCWRTRFGSGLFSKYVTQNIEFPWRVFFPYLSWLDFDYVDDPTIPLMLRTCLLANALDVNKVNNFIASGFWNLPSLRQLQSHTYPSYTHLVIPHTENPTDETAAKEHSELRTLAPLLARTYFEYDDGLTAEDIELLPITKALGCNRGIHAGASDRFISFCTLKANTAPASPENQSLSLSQSSLGSTSGLTFIQAEEYYGFGESPSLRRIICTLSDFSNPLIHQLPLTITSMRATISEPWMWDLMAKKLVHLSTLHLTLHTWKCSRTLAPISSRNLYAFYLTCGNSPQEEENIRPMFYEFFGPDSPLPLDLNSLSIFLPMTAEPKFIPMTIIPALPRKLKHLYIWGAGWADTDYPPYPHSIGLSPLQLLESLPRSLTKLELHVNQVLAKEMVCPHFSILRGLPSHLREFNQSDLFGVNEPASISFLQDPVASSDEINQIVDILPPALNLLIYAHHARPNYFSMQATYRNRRRSNLYIPPKA